MWTQKRESSPLYIVIDIFIIYYIILACAIAPVYALIFIKIKLNISEQIKE